MRPKKEFNLFIRKGRVGEKNRLEKSFSGGGGHLREKKHPNVAWNEEKWAARKAFDENRPIATCQAKKSRIVGGVLLVGGHRKMTKVVTTQREKKHREGQIYRSI